MRAILELKQVRPSALRRLVPQREGPEGEEAERIVRSHDVHLAAGDPYYGYTTLGGQNFLVRERSPYKKEVDLDDLGPKGLKTYARICGQVPAQARGVFQFVPLEGA